VALAAASLVVACAWLSSLVLPERVARSLAAGDQASRCELPLGKVEDIGGLDAPMGAAGSVEALWLGSAAGAAAEPAASFRSQFDGTASRLMAQAGVAGGGAVVWRQSATGWPSSWRPTRISCQGSPAAVLLSWQLVVGQPSHFFGPARFGTVRRITVLDPPFEEPLVILADPAPGGSSSDDGATATDRACASLAGGYPSGVQVDGFGMVVVALRGGAGAAPAAQAGADAAHGVVGNTASRAAAVVHMGRAVRLLRLAQRLDDRPRAVLGPEALRLATRAGDSCEATAVALGAPDREAVAARHAAAAARWASDLLDSPHLRQREHTSPVNLAAAVVPPVLTVAVSAGAALLESFRRPAFA